MTAPPFRIIRQPLLTLGGAGIDDNGIWAILLDAESNHAEQTVTLWHETVHLLLLAAGIDAPHDEDQVEAIAHKLAQACPEILQLCGLAP